MNTRGDQSERFFLPESVDERVDQLSQTPPQPDGFHVSDARLVHDLYSVSRDYTAMRDRVWHRLVTHTADETHNAHHAQNDPVESDKIQKFPPERVHTMQQEVLYPRRTGVQRLALVAAALVAAILVGSLVLVFSLAQRSGSASPGRQQHNAATSIPSNYQPFCGSQNAVLDAGWHAICLAHQEKALDVVKTFQGDVVTFEAAYADNNRVIVMYSTKYKVFPFPPRMPTYGMSLTLETRDGTDLNGLGSSGELPRNTDTGFAVQSFDTSAIPATTNTLNLRLNGAFDKFVAKRNQEGKLVYDGVQAETFSIDFSLPLHAGRVANLHQTVTVDGIPVTLDRVIVSPSQTRLYVLSSQLQITDSIPQPYSLSVNSWHTNQYGFDTGSTIPGKIEPYLPVAGVILMENTSLFNQQGQWTFKIAPGGVVGGKGTWIFHFTVPAA